MTQFNNSPKVSVIINCYNAEKYLREAIDSVFAQTYKNWEIILWDNASTDKTAEIAKSYPADRVKYFRGEVNVPLYAARNLAVPKATGEFIGFLDSDDIWLPTKLEKQVPLFRNDKVALVYSDCFLFNDAGNFSSYFLKRPFMRGNRFRELLVDYFIPMPTALVRRSVLSQFPKAFDDRYDIIGDADTFRRIALNWEIDCVEEPLARYRVHRGSLSWKKVEKFSVEIRQSIADYLREIPGFKEKYASELHKLEFDAAWSDAKIWVRNGKREEARRALKPFLGFKKAKALFLATFLPNVLYCALERTYLKRYGFS